MHLYKEPSKISGTDAAIWSKTNFRPPEVVPFHVNAPFSVLLPFFKCILEVVFFENIQHRQRIFLDHLNCVKIEASLLSSIGETENSRMGRGDDSHVMFGKKFPGEKGTVRLSVVVMQ
jgi:hypothetical protein